MGRATPPFRADHVGSLLRPRRLLQARDDHAAGRMSDEELRAVEDDAIRDVVAMQRDVGLQSATDGEFRRASWHMDFIYRLGGVSRAPEHLKVQFRNPTGTIEFTSAALKIDGKVRLEQTVFGEDFQALQAMVTSATTPSSPSRRRTWSTTAAARRRSTATSTPTWSSSGATWATPTPSRSGASASWAAPTSSSTTPASPTSTTRRSERWSPGVATTPSICICATSSRSTGRWRAGRRGWRSPPMCRGNFRSSGPPRAATTSSRRRCSAGSGSTASSWSTTTRSGGFEPLRFVPKDKLVVLGLVTTKRGELEDKDLLKRRIEDASRFVPLEQLCLSPQCGFSSTVEGNLLTDRRVAKLRLIVETPGGLGVVAPAEFEPALPPWGYHALDHALAC